MLSQPELLVMSHAQSVSNISGSEDIMLQKKLRLNAQNRGIVTMDYETSVLINQKAFDKGDIRAGQEYIYKNQREDAFFVVNTFYQRPEVRAISCAKRTKVGANGFMVEIAKLFATHNDEDFIIQPEKILFITGMSNIAWESEMKEFIPACFRDNVYHHGKLNNLEGVLSKITDAVIIVDEIDTGDKEDQRLHKVLKESGVLNINYMEEYNVRFIFISATISENQKDLFRWGEKHTTHRLTIPAEYIGHKEFLEKGILKEFYKISSEESALKWIKEDIIDYYGHEDTRVHIIRTTEKEKSFIEYACGKYNIEFYNHTSTDRITENELKNIFDKVKTQMKHCVIAVKGFYRRANLIPNKWKMLIGATHERCVNMPNENVQVQGLPGRMTGYWKSIIDNGHKTGPHRTSLSAIEKYEKWYENPWIIFCNNDETIRRITNPELSNQVKDTTVEYNVDQKTNKRPPVIISINPDVTRQLTGRTLSHEKKCNIILSELEKDPKLSNIINFIRCPDVKCKQITTPTTDSSRKKHILDIVDKHNQNQSCTVDLTKEDKKVNNWQAFIDKFENRICIVTWCLNTSWTLSDITY